MNKEYFKIKLVRSTLKYGIVVAILFFSSCLAPKKGSSNSAPKLFETFYVGDEGTQYFIKPLFFKDLSNNRLTLDITFRYKDKIKDTAIVNISLLNSERFKSIDSLKISNDSVSLVLKDFKFLFSERLKGDFNSRFSTTGQLEGIFTLFNQNNWLLTVYTQNSVSKYSPPKDTKKKITKLQYSVFSTF